MKLPTVRLSGVTRALAIGAVSPLLMSVVLHAQAAAESPAPAPEKAGDEEKELVVLEKFEVVGSRIKRIDTETVSPVVKVHSRDLSLTGFATVGDALRSLPFNGGQAQTPADSGTSFTPGVSTINLRGLGNNNSLVLINGRRTAPYALPGYDGFQTMFDLNSVSEAAIDSMEILKDGGSAIYGSDAVGGVLNIKFREDFTGVRTRLKVGDYFGTGGMLKQASVVAGQVSGNTSVVTTLDWQRRDAVLARDIAYTANADKTAEAHRASPAYRASGWEEAGFASEQAYLEAAYDQIEQDEGWRPSGDPAADGWFDNRSSRGYPGYLSVTFLDKDGKPYSERMTYEAPTTSPIAEDAVPGLNPNNYQQASGLFPKQELYSFFTTIKHRFSENLYGFADLMFTRSSALSITAPTPVDLEAENGLTSTTRMYYPASNPYNPWGEDIYNGRRRLVEVANRVSDITSDTPRVVAGFGGQFAGLRDWSWEAAGLYARNKVKTNSLGVVPDFRLQQALLGLTRAGDGSLSWNPATPDAERVFFNWYGPNPAEFADFLMTENATSASLELQSVDVSANGSVIDLPAGPLALAVGAEHRREKYANNRTALNAEGNIVSGDEGTSSRGSRKVTSVYAELGIPVAKQFEVQLAGRYEQYSDDGFARSVRPKIGFKFHPLSWLTLRGSFSKSFKAPDLAYLYTSSQTSFESNQMRDPVTGTEIDGLQVVTTGVPTLKPELADTYYAGIAIEPKSGLLKGFSLSIDGFRFEQTNLLAKLGDFYSYSDFLTRAADGDPVFAAKVVRDEQTGEVRHIRDNYDNLSTGFYQGIDIDAAYEWHTGALGDFRVGAAATWVDSVKGNEDEFVGGRTNARWNANGSFAWRFRDWEWNVYGVLRGARTETIDYGPVFGEDDDLYVTYRLRQQFTVNTSVTYRGFRKFEITVGVNNVFDRDPPLDLQEALGTTPGVNDPEPSFWYVAVEREF